MRAIVTGHTRGLGAALCAALLERGAAVLGLSRGENVQLARQWPELLTQRKIDLCDHRALAAMVESSPFSDFLSGAAPAVLINNAGLLQPIHVLGHQGATAIAQAIAVNVGAPLILADAFVGASGDSADRRVLHVSSGAARQAYAGWSVYCASKAALDHHARAIHAEGAARLRAASVAPGVIDTEMQAEIRGCDATRFPQVEKFEALQREGQLASPTECAQRLVDYLLSPRFGEQPVTDLRDL